MIAPTFMDALGISEHEFGTYTDESDEREEDKYLNYDYPTYEGPSEFLCCVSQVIVISVW